MSLQKQTWQLLRKHKQIPMQHILEHLTCKRTSIVPYIRALEKAGFVSVEHSGKGNAISSVTLLKDAKEYPLFNRGIVKTKDKALHVNYSAQAERQRPKAELTIFKHVVHAFLELGADEVRIADVCKKMDEIRGGGKKHASSYISRWVHFLEDRGVITCTGSYRNSKIYLVNLKKIKTFLL